MKKYTLTSYDPIHIVLPKPQVPADLVETQIKKMLEPFSEYREIAEDRPVSRGDYLVVTTDGAKMDGTPAPNFIMSHSLYHVGSGEMPRSFDNELVGMGVGETKHIEIGFKLPISPQGEDSKLAMEVSVERILDCTPPVLDDDFVKEHFEPAQSVEEFRKTVAGGFGLPDMKKDNPEYPDLLLGELSKRLVEKPDEADLMPGQPLEALKATCAIDALADYLDLELTHEQIIAQMPGSDAEQREKIYKQLQDQGIEDEARVFAHREAALSWLVNKSKVSYK